MYAGFSERQLSADIDIKHWGINAGKAIHSYCLRKLSVSGALHFSIGGCSDNGPAGRVHMFGTASILDNGQPLESGEALVLAHPCLPGVPCRIPDTPGFQMQVEAGLVLQGPLHRLSP